MIGWISDSYCSLKPLCSGMGEVVPARTSPTLLPPSPRTCCNYPVSKCLSASIVVTSTLRVKRVHESTMLQIHVTHESHLHQYRFPSTFRYLFTSINKEPIIYQWVAPITSILPLPAATPPTPAFSLFDSRGETLSKPNHLMCYLQRYTTAYSSIYF